MKGLILQKGETELGWYGILADWNGSHKLIASVHIYEGTTYVANYFICNKKGKADGELFDCDSPEEAVQKMRKGVELRLKQIADWVQALDFSNPEKVWN